MSDVENLTQEMRAAATWRVAGAASLIGTMIVCVALVGMQQKGLAVAALVVGASLAAGFWVLQASWTLRFLRSWFASGTDTHQAYVGRLRRVGAVPFLVSGAVAILLIVLRLAR